MVIGIAEVLEASTVSGRTILSSARKISCLTSSFSKTASMTTSASAAASRSVVAVMRARATDRLKWVDNQLAGKAYVMGDTFSVADAYLFTVARWSKLVGIDISGLTELTAYLERVAARPAVQAAMKAEGLLKAA